MRWKRRTAGMATAALLSLWATGCGDAPGGGETPLPETLAGNGTSGTGGSGGGSGSSGGGDDSDTGQGGSSGSLTDLFSGGASKSLRKCNRWVKAHVVALEQVFSYNRWGAFNPTGMMYALRRDVESIDGSSELRPGHVRLKEDRRPRPLVLRVNEGDCLEVKFTNLLSPERKGVDSMPETAGVEGVPWHVPMRNMGLPPGNAPGDGPGSIQDPVGMTPVPVDPVPPVPGLPTPAAPGSGPGGPGEPGPEEPAEPGDNAEGRNEHPRTRAASVHVQGLQYLDIDSDGANVGKNDSSLADPGETRTYRFLAAKEGTYLFYSGAHLAGGQGDNAALASGLFGAVNVEPQGSVWYRSQVTAHELKKAIKGHNPDGTPRIDYNAEHNGRPVLKILDEENEIVHGDLNAIIARFRSTELVTPTSRKGAEERVFREFTSIFHDEIQVVQAFPELEADPTLRPIGDLFAINYGVEGFGPRLLANRKRIGPAKDCGECKYEEFFLNSWPSGDPAQLVEMDRYGKVKKVLFPDDPSNVHHSYVGDPVRFRNMHAGPRETHVFHLHAHQWLHSPRDDDSNYFDSQSISPGSAFTYDINFGGGGNRNLTVGDAIYHCHLYPHLVSGMWAIWRNHDVFEAGTKDRYLPDGEIKEGTPTPAVVPLPGLAMPPMPTYEDGQVTLADGSRVWRPAFPGYPFYIAAEPGHRAPQPPLDLEFDGGLQRHIVTDVKEVRRGRRGRFDVELERINIKLLQEEGTPSERVAMDFHAGKLRGGRPATTRYGFPAAAYPAFTPEGDRAEFFVNGQDPRPGAPFADPCPQGTPERHYRVSHIQVDLVVNKDGWHDPQGRIMALDGDVDAFVGGTVSPQPLVMRINSGECAVIHVTNLLPPFLEEDDFQIFIPTDISGMHVHLVKFDVTASDGANNGFNYEDGSFGAEEVQERIEAANAAGGAFKCDGTTKAQGERMKLRPQRHPRIASAQPGAQTNFQRWWADPIVNEEGEDRTVGTSFTHDHFLPAGQQQHGLYAGLAVEPAGSTWRDPFTGVPLGTREDGGPMPSRADILTPDPAGSFREYNLTFHDFALLYDRRGRPINEPDDDLRPLPIAIEDPERARPEAVSAADPGAMMVNYRNEPIPLRIAKRSGNRYQQREGAKGDMENVFRSDIHGDPATPLLRAYPGDKVHIRLLEGAHEEFHSFSLHGLKWLHEYADPDSGFMNAQGFAISERWELLDRMPPISGETADFLWQSVATDDLWNGQWGLLRVYRDEQPDLLPLPGNPFAGLSDIEHPVCPDHAPKRRYTVYALTAKDNLPQDKLLYNKEHHLFDPDAILYVLDAHVDDLLRGKRRPEPLILRANAGDCIEVTLINAFPHKMPKTPHWNFLPAITPRFNVNQVRPSNHASLHPQLVEYDIRHSDGANIGLNPVQTVEPGGMRTYRWYAGRWKLKEDSPVLFPLRPAGGLQPQHTWEDLWEAEPVEYGAVNLRDVADVVNHGMHGGIGALIIEPPGATWKTDEDTDASATVRYTDNTGQTRRFREFVLLYQDEVALHSRNPDFQCADPRLNCGTALLPYGGVEDPEESGHKAFNYRTEPLWARIGVRPEEAIEALNDVDQSELLDSGDFGDPETPLFEAKAGDEVRFRVLQPSGHPRVHAFAIHGHEWQHDAWAQGAESRLIGENPDSNILSVQDTHTPMRHWNILPLYGAGGAYGVKGDFLYRDMPSVQFPSGLWGIFRVR